MIKRSLKNFFINLKYYFTPLGMIALSVIIAIAIAVPAITGSVRGLVDYVTSLDGVSLDFNAFLHSIFDAGRALPWKNPAKAISTMLSKDWLNATLRDSIFALAQNAEGVSEQIIERISSCVNSLVYAAIAVIVFVFVGIVGGFFLTKSLIRRQIAKRSFWKYLLVSVFDALVTAGLPVLSLFLGTLWAPSFYLSVILFPILWSVIALLEAYIVHGMKVVKMKEVVTFKNCASLMLANLIIVIMASAVTSLLTAFTNGFIGFFIGLPFIEIALIVIGLNAESYVKELAEKTEQANQKEEASE